MAEPLLQIEGLKKYFPITAGMWRSVVGYVKAVDDVSFFINPGETLGLVGESGCGKTTTGRLIVRLLERTAGELSMQLNGEAVDLGAMAGQQLRTFRRHMQMIFQD